MPKTGSGGRISLSANVVDHTATAPAVAARLEGGDAVGMFRDGPAEHLGAIEAVERRIDTVETPTAATSSTASVICTPPDREVGTVASIRAAA